jgi:hypothetical protein
MRCFLHIGTEKTGTTSLQSFLNNNRKKLKEDGLIYTKSAGEKNNRALAVLAYSRLRSDDYTKSQDIKNPAQLLLHQKIVFDRLKDEINDQKINHNQHSVIFSSEHIQSRLKRPIEIQRLKAVLAALGMTDIKVIIYLRRPASLANSLYSTLLRAGGTATAPPYPDSPHWNNLCNHQQTITKFGQVFGKKNIIPRIYSQSALEQQSIDDDFLSIFNLSTAGYITTVRSNTRLSATAASLLRHLNHQIPRFLNDKPNPLRANLASYIENSFEGKPYIMPADLYRAYDSAFAASDEWVRQHFFPHLDRLFDREIPEKTESTLSEADIEMMAALIGKIWIEKQTRINNMANKLQAVSAC